MAAAVTDVEISRPTAVAPDRADDLNAIEEEEERLLPAPKPIKGLTIEDPNDLVTPDERAAFQKIAEEIERARRLAQSRLTGFIVS
jgi:hypothetical protein